RMLDQLFIPFVGVVDGVKKSFRIGHVDGYGDAQPAAFLPNGIEPRIIYSEQLARFVANAQAEVLQYLQTASAARDCIIQLLHHLLAETGVVDLAPVDLREAHTPSRIG